jgi:hypothetical protein
MESRFRVERDRKRHSERVSLPLAYTRASHGKSEATPTTVLLLFLFSLFFWGILVTRKKWWCKLYEGPLFLFSGGRGAGRREGNRAQSMCPNHRGEKKPNFFRLELIISRRIVDISNNKKNFNHQNFEKGD